MELETTLRKKVREAGNPDITQYTAVAATRTRIIHYIKLSAIDCAWNRARAVIAVGSTTREATTNDDNRQLGTRENLTSEKGGRDES